MAVVSFCLCLHLNSLLWIVRSRSLGSQVGRRAGWVLLNVIMVVLNTAFTINNKANSPRTPTPTVTNPITKSTNSTTAYNSNNNQVTNKTNNKTNKTNKTSLYTHNQAILYRINMMMNSNHFKPQKEVVRMVVIVKMLIRLPVRQMEEI